jgi:streptogramin lyase
MGERNQLYLVEEFPGGQQTFGIAASASGVFFADAEGRAVGHIEPNGRLTILKLPGGQGRPHGLAACEDDIWLAEWSKLQRESPLSTIDKRGFIRLH